MSDESKGDAPKKALNTKDILAAARAAASAKSSAGSEPAPAAAPVESAPAASAPAPETKSAPAAKPGSTADILAAARAAAAAKKAAEGGAAAEEKPKPAPKPAAKPAAGGAGPKSTADILAAARAGTKGAAAPAAASEPAEKGVAAKAPAKASPKAPAAEAGGAKLSVQEMLAAVRPASAVAPDAPAEAPKKEAKVTVAPPMPAKPAASKKGAAPVDSNRRGILLAFLLSPFALAWTMFAAASGVATLGMLRFMLPNVLTEPPRKFKVGPPTDYDLGTVATKWVASFGIWLVHTDQYRGKNLIYALASVCTHLGCTPSWLEGEQKFKCPCHGSGFYITGVNFEGPAPRPLERVGIRLSEDGMLEVDKSVKFQEEMGQWTDPNSFVEIA